MQKQTRIINIDKYVFDLNKKKYEAALNEAALIIRNGGLVVFPTETVYGIGADATNCAASKKIYAAKNRPSDNPLIVHISKFEEIYKYAKNVDDRVKKLADKFCPGPLTFILNKSEIIPYETSGGLDTVGIRIPSNNIARELINLSATAIAAPSANISGRPSPTRYKHVFDDMYGRVDCIINGGDCDIGLESSIIDMTGEIPIMLRPGAISIDEILYTLDINTNEYEDYLEFKSLDGKRPKAPGMKYRHYAPKADVFIVDSKEENVANNIFDLCKKDEHTSIGIIISYETKDYLMKNELFDSCDIIDDNGFKCSIKGTNKIIYIKVIGKRYDGERIAANLFNVLRDFDEINDIDIIYAEDIYAKDMNMAIKDRLYKAAGHNIKKVRN